MEKISCFFILSLIISSYSYNLSFSEVKIHQENKKIDKNEKSSSVNKEENSVEQKSKKKIIAESNQEKKQKKNDANDIAKEANKDNNEIEKKNKQKQNYYIVKSGENIYRISKKYDITCQELIKLNNLKDNNIYVGQKLILPKNAFLREDINENERNSESAKNKNSNKNLINKLDATTFIWPSRGIILTKFGYKTRTGRLEGVNIGGEMGSTVKASSSGIVVYNNTIEGYDNVIIIRHYNGFITAYGHVNPVVTIGREVKKGEVIAYMKKNKQSERSQLYFTIRKDGKSYDPEKIIQTEISG